MTVEIVATRGSNINSRSDRELGSHPMIPNDFVMLNDRNFSQASRRNLSSTATLCKATSWTPTGI
jgi:hypothetical protein